MTSSANFLTYLEEKIQNDAPAFTFLDGDQSHSLSFADLGHAAKAMAADIQAYVEPGGRVLVSLPPGEDYVIALVACIFAGVVSVPTVPPSAASALPRLELIAQDASASLVITSDTIATQLREFGGVLADIPALTRTNADSSARTWKRPVVDQDDLLFLQYTSGSTANPKGVIVRHRNAIANLELCQQKFELSNADTIVSWLPPHHDFGLVGGILSALYTGCHAVHLTPMAFFRRPQRWLQAITDYKATVTGAPDFAWDLCVRRIPEDLRKNFDLNHLRIAINGAERVRPETIAAFVDAFSMSGFSADAVTPAYGLAEATLLVATSAGDHKGLPRSIEAPAQDDTQFTHSGTLVTNGAAQNIAILNEAGVALPEDQIGEICITGPSVCSGYWNNPEASVLAFGQQVDGFDTPFVRSGDLGFIQAGELFVSGRLSEMILMSGRNIFPQDIEPDIAALSASFRASGCAVFATEKDRATRLVIVQEILSRKDLHTDGLVEKLRLVLAENHDISDLAAIYLVRGGSLPRTTSGKIRRLRCSQIYEAGEFSPLWSWDADHAQTQSDFVAARTPVELQLAEMWRDLLDVEHISIRDNFMEMSGDSLLATQVISALHQQFDVDISLRALFEFPNIEALAGEIERTRAAQARAEAASWQAAQPCLLSPAQSRLFYLDQFAPADPVYQLGRALQIDGEIDMAALSAAATELTRRHDVLRLRFTIKDGAPAGEITPLRQIGPRLVEIPNAFVALKTAEDEISAPFDLLAGELFRLSLLSEDEDSHYLVFCAHCAVADEASLDILIQEFATLYSGYAEGITPDLPEPSLQFKDVCAWQKDTLSGTHLENHLAFWSENLADTPALLSLPTDRARPSVQEHSAATIERFIPENLLRSDDPEAQLTAAYAVLLYRYSGQHDLCIGRTIVERKHPGTSGLIAPLSNTFVQRVTLSSDMGFGDVQAACVTAQKATDFYSNTPFDLVVEALQPERHLSHSPIFQVALEFVTPQKKTPEMYRLSARPMRLPISRGHYDVTLQLEPTSGGYSAQVVYASALFDARTMDAFADDFLQVLRQAQDSTAPLLAQPLPSKETCETVLTHWNNTDAGLNIAPLHHLFEAQVLVSPDADCVISGDTSLCFSELNARANQLAHVLRGHGAGPDVTVGLSVTRSIEMMVGLLAVLKAGGAWVPLDPALPTDRLNYMINDAAPVVLLATPETHDHLPETTLPIVDLDEQFDTPKTAPDVQVSPENLAYIIYTSGSTGTPKGVAVPHAGVANRLQWMTQAYGVAPQERVMQKTPYSFDVSVWELFWPLVSGATLVMAKPEGHQDVAYLADLIHTQKITTLHFVPPMLEVFLDLVNPQDCASLRQVLCSGQALPVNLQNRFREVLPGVVLRNLYGPTEASIEVSHWDCLPIDGQMSVPIGHPIANTQLYILDPGMNPVPIGVAGELYLAGAGVARGYQNRADLTAAAFIPDPFGAPGARMYRSGDLARHLPNGAIEYLGRVDDQVKIRGSRIELGEIEARLHALPEIGDAVVMARNDIAGDPRLVAWIVGDVDARDDQAIRQALLNQLPDYMVPTHLIWLNELPLTLNGKVDRRALPTPDLGQESSNYIAPKSKTEKSLTEIWAQLLGREKISVSDRFFDLGGHSLLATQAISKIRAGFGVDIALRSILFDKPTISELAPEIDAQVRASRGTRMTTIPLAPRDDDPALSFSQQRLWFLDQLEPNNPFYNIPAPTWLRGPLDIDAMTRALNTIMARHDSLRTIFEVRDTQPVQVILPEVILDIPIIDLSTFAPEVREEKAKELAVSDAQAPFTLHQSPLVRAQLLRLADAEHMLLFNMHHIVSDGWSMGVLVTEFVAIYRAYTEGRDTPLPPLSIQYIDFAAWQHKWLQGDNLQNQLKYWRETLADCNPVLALPTDHPRPAAQSYKGATYDVTIPQDIVSELYALGARHQATLFMTLLSAFNILQSRYARTDDLNTGTYIANRNRAEIEGLIGFFVNMLVLRTKIDPNESFETLLKDVRATALDAYAHQDLPFEHLVDELKPERSLSHSPLFQTVFVLQNTPMDDLDASGLQTAPVAIESHVSKFDLTLRLTEKNGTLEGCFEYATDLFKRETIAAMADQFFHLLGEIITAPHAPVSSLRLQSESETRLIADASVGAKSDLGNLPTVFAAFTQHVRDTPHQIAIAAVSETDTNLTYQGLDDASDILALQLTAQGVTSGSVIGLLLERGANYVVAILAALKAGAAWLPLDPEAPKARRKFIIDDAKPHVILTTTPLSLTMEGIDAPTLCLETLTRPATDVVLSQMTLNDPAYVLYTSGTTGQPKGVITPLRGLINHANHHIDMCDLTPNDRVMFFANPSFDTSIEEIIPTLMAGATLVPRPQELLDTGHVFNTFVDTHDITVLDLPTRFWHHWSTDSTALPLSVRLVIVGGEKVEAQQFSDWAARSDTKDIRWINTYGPTEASIISTAFEPQPGHQDEIPIGRAIAGVYLRILDDHLQPMPVGVPGEICIGGAGLAKGYLGQDEQTKCKFIDDPFSDGKLYRTGDLGRLQPDGNIAYIGRLDDQIKLRGFRIEPSEIEAALLSAGASEAVVMVKDISQDPRLIAWVTGDVAARSLQASLSLVLPVYMLPWRIVVLDDLPLTGNGKVDRRGLPLPDDITVGALPEGAVEVQVAAIWAEVLGLDAAQIGRHANFFTLGGHSLLATRVISRIRSEFGIELPLRSLFSAPELAALAAEICTAVAQDEGGALPAPVALNLAEDVARPLSWSQQRLWFLDQLQPNDIAYNMPVSLHLKGALDPTAFALSLAAITTRHEALRACFRLENGAPVQHILPRSEITPDGLCDLHDLSDLHLTSAEAPEVQNLILETATTGFDLARGPFLRARLIRLAPEDHIAVLCLHHIASDGWSMGVLQRELQVLYPAARALPSDPKADPIAAIDALLDQADLPPMTIQYGDYARWQRDWLQGPVHSRQLTWWQQHLKGLPALLDLPLDHPRPAVQSHKGAITPLVLPADLVERLNAFAQDQGATLHMVLSGVLSVLLSRWSLSDDIAIGTPVAGRRHEALEGMIGFFINTLIIRSHVDHGEGFTTLLGRLREDALEAQAHQDLPFEHLVEALQPARDLSHAPLFQVMLALQNTPPTQVNAGDLAMAPLPFRAPGTKFDLTFSLHEDRDDITGVSGPLTGVIEYATDLFEPATIIRLAQQFVTLAEAITFAPKQPIGALPLMDATARAEMITKRAAKPAINAETDAAYASLDGLFARAAARFPDRVALRFDGVDMTYRTLDARANQLAHLLVVQGAGPELRIGLCVERSFEMIIGILAVLKAGAAWVPLDPDHPDERLEYMLSDAAPICVLTQEKLMDRLQGISDTPLINLNNNDATTQPKTPPNINTNTKNTAYVIYTSGSTGKPKGVIGTHDAIVNRVQWLDRTLDVNPEDRMVQKTPYGFDVSIGEIFLPLVAGAMLVISRPGGHVDVTYLAGLVRTEEITIIHFVPPMVEASIGLADASDYKTLRAVMCSGQALPRTVQDRLTKFVPHIQLHNLYGPTEAAVEVTHWTCHPDDSVTGSGVPIGHAIDNVAMYILDDGFEPVPEGMPGHLYIGGIAPARGYINRPDLTAGAFLPDPFSAPGSRMYRTGDLARFLPDRVIDYLGRADDQLKIRGVRIEPGEVEAAILASGIREAVVVAGPDATGEMGLLAYIVAPEFNEADLREALTHRVPDFMMPSAFVVVDAVPLTPNGKINKRALPAPNFSKVVDYVAPNTPTEEKICAIWAEVLGLPKVGITDNFFTLGGHSLKAVTALNDVRDVFDVEIGLEKAFALQTVEMLARYIDGHSTPQDKPRSGKLRI